MGWKLVSITPTSRNALTAIYERETSGYVRPVAIQPQAVEEATTGLEIQTNEESLSGTPATVDVPQRVSAWEKLKAFNQQAIEKEQAYQSTLNPEQLRRRKRNHTILGAILFAFVLILCVSSVIGGMSNAVNSDNKTQASVSTPTLAITTSSAVHTPVVVPSPTVKPTPKPTPTPNAEQRSILQEGQDCASRSYQSQYNADHTELSVIAASGVIDSQGNPQPWFQKTNAIEAGKAIILCLQKYLWAQEPDLQQIEVVVWGQLKDKTGNVGNLLVGATLTQTTAANFDWTQTPGQAWAKYDQTAIK